MPYGVTFDVHCIRQKSQDYKVTKITYVKQLLELCLASGLKLANGGVLCNPAGKYMCHKYNHGTNVGIAVIITIQALMKCKYMKAARMFIKVV